jgi:hypothetical protein
MRKAGSQEAGSQEEEQLALFPGFLPSSFLGLLSVNLINGG